MKPLVWQPVTAVEMVLLKFFSELLNKSGNKALAGLASILPSCSVR